MHLSLGRTRFNAFRFGSDSVRPINNGADLHYSRSWTVETWRIAEEEEEEEGEGEGEKEGEGEGAAALSGGLRELRSTVLQLEQWRHGAEGEGEGAAALGGGEGAALHCSSTWTVESPLFTLQNSGARLPHHRQGPPPLPLLLLLLLLLLLVLHFSMSPLFTWTVEINSIVNGPDPNLNASNRSDPNLNALNRMWPSKIKKI